MVSIDNGQGHFQGEELDINNIRLVSSDKTAGASVCLGIRPQHLIVDSSGPLRGTVTLVEQLGTETVLELVTDRQVPFRFASAQSIDVSLGQQVGFRFDPGMAHLF